MEFMAKWQGSGESSFIQYYDRNWHSRIDRWAKGYRTYTHCNQDSHGSIEKWHATLKQYLQGSGKEKSARRIKCLHLLGGFTEVQLLHRLRTRWGSISGGVQNLYAGNQPIDAEVQEVEISVETLSSDSEDNDDCVIIRCTKQTDEPCRKILPLAHFQKEVGKLYSQVSHSSFLCGRAYEFLLQAVKQTLDVKASRELQDATTDDDQHPQLFVPVPGNDSSLKRKNDFLEKLYSKPKRPGAKNIENMSTEIDDDNCFQTIPTTKMTMQEALDKATHELLDLNASFCDNKEEMKPVLGAPSKRKRHNRDVNISMKQQVGAGKQPTNIIVID
ncbi:hypothetical protein R1sor_016962 [Riccia sorocarpa]|uniref:Uncharacterized protein n=1 Tax=Riccia sorocarpa TaxID=122646 RepID=A0ABD3I5F8_9MARC